MRNKANPRLVGIFVLGAFALLIGAILTFGRLSIGARPPPVVVYFEGSISGLSVGAPVNFRGVRVGSVSNIALQVDSRNLTARIPVQIAFLPNTLSWIGEPLMQSGEFYKDLVAKGLRAQLVIESFVTGQQMVELDFMPSTPATLVGGPAGVQEIAAVKSTFQTLRERLEQLPLNELVAVAMRTFNSANGLLTSPEMHDALVALTKGLDAFQTTMGTTNGAVKTLTGDIDAVAAEARNTLTEASAALPSVEADLKQALSDLSRLTRTTDAQVEPLSRAAQGTLTRGETALDNVNGMIGPNAALRSDLEATLRNLVVSSRSLRSLTEELERRPNSLLIGR